MVRSDKFIHYGKRPKQTWEGQGFKFVEGEPLTPEYLRTVAAALRPDYIRHPGVESINDAKKQRSQSLEDRIPAVLVGTCFLDLNFESGHALGWGHIDFKYEDNRYSFCNAWGLNK